MPLSNLLRGSLQFIIFGGKGGVGKTTCGAAAGLYLAQCGRRALVYSVDPAHSLSDIFNQAIGNKVTRISRVDGLYALEINAKQLLDELKSRYREAVDEALSQFLRGIDLPFEREIMRDIMEFSPPGLDELMALSKLNDIVKKREYDVIIIDTAAGAHTIRLLELPDIVEEWIEKALQLHDRYRYVMPLERGRAIAEELMGDVKTLKEYLTDQERTMFVSVTIPEAMGIYVTEDMTRGLRACGIPYRSIIVNFIISPSVKCEYCLSRRKGQMKRIAEIHARFPQCEILEAPMFPKEIKGIDALMSFAKVLFEGEHEPRLYALKPELPGKTLPILTGASRLSLSERNLQLIMFGGKGGCGKTTCSAAAGIHMARRDKRTLVVSTDPQRSLSDSFGQELSDEVAQINGVSNLYGLEIDAEKLLNQFREEHREEILEIATAATYLEREDIIQFLELSLPGMDEVMALMRIMELMKGGEYDLFILDTAPTGHTLRFLELPDVMSNWMKLLIKMRSKTQYMIQRFFHQKVRDKADIFLEETMSDIKTIKATLTDPSKTEFIVMTTLEETAINEADRLISTLLSHRLPLRQIVVNGLVPPSVNCVYCSSKNEEQQKVFKNLYGRFSNLKIIGMPLFPHEILGIDDLGKFAEVLFQEFEWRRENVTYHRPH